MMKKTILLLTVFLFSLLYSNIVNADVCGGSEECHCGDTVTSSYTLLKDLTCNTPNPPYFALELYLSDTSTQDLIFDCNNYIINSTLLHSNSQNNFIGLEIHNENYPSNTHKIIIKNCVIKDFDKGIEFQQFNQISDTIITHNSFINNSNGVYIGDGSNFINISIQDNSFSGNGDYAGFGDWYYGAINIREYINDPNYKIDINHNCMINNPGFGVYIDYPVTYLSNIKINYNTIDNNFPSTNKLPGSDNSEIGLCFSNSDTSFCKDYLLNDINNLVNITYNFWNYNGNWQSSYFEEQDLYCLSGEVSILQGLGSGYGKSRVENANCCPRGNSGVQFICKLLPYLDSNPIPNWEICTDGIDNDCDHLIDSQDSACNVNVCGNGQINTGELCDDGTALNSLNNRCKPDCTWNTCGDSSVCSGSNCGSNPETILEQCDSGPPLNLNGQTCESLSIMNLGGTLNCYPPLHPLKCTFNTANCIACGLEGQSSSCDPLPLGPQNGYFLNQQDSCCTISQSAPGFACRRYETANYALKCCQNDLETSRMCGTVGGTSLTPCITNVNDIACCSPSTEDDCVYNGLCYTDDNNANSAELWANMSCSSKHWCPVGFYWDEDYQTCLPAETPCYSGPSTTYCNTATPPSFIFNLNNPYDCLYGGPGSQPIYQGSLPYEQACCYWTSFLINYYEWKDVKVYGNPSGSGFGSGE